MMFLSDDLVVIIVFVSV